jgi:hypothetical protein
MNDHDGLPGIAFLSACWRWFEELIVVLSAPMLLFGAGITVVDLLTDGSATLAVPWLLFAWAVSQAMGIEANVSGAVHKAKLAYERGAWFPMILYILLVCALGAVVIIAGYAYSYHQAQGIPIQDSLRDLGIDPAMWTMSRSILAFALIAISAAMRFTGKKPDAASKAQKLREEIELLPLQQQKRELQLHGVQRLTAQARGKAPPPAMGAPTPSTTPLVVSARTDDDASLDENGDSGAYISAVSGPNGGYISAVGGSAKRRVRTGKSKRAPRGSLSWEQSARDAWQPGMTIDQLTDAVPGMKRTAGAHWRAVIMAEERERQKQALREA